MYRKIAVVLALFVLASVSLSAMADSVSLSTPASDYILAPDDVIEMNVWRETELSKRQFRINAEGNITVPYLNYVIKAAGLTQQQLAQLLTDEYEKAEILVNPKIDVNVIIRHTMAVMVLGQVNRPGKVEFKEGDTITSAIAQAGSYTDAARLESAVLTRRGSDKTIPIDLRKLYHDGDLSQNYQLQEDDVIYVPEDTFNRFYVLGEVTRPGLYMLKDNASVLSAVSQAGGPTERGSMKGVMLVRGDINNPEKRSVDLNKMIKGDLSQDVKLEAGDVVYVPETNKPDWGKISQILNALASIGSIKRYGIF
ncbi:MAG: SLBB domain-containing protein [Armatimonadota bacterium]